MKQLFPAIVFVVLAVFAASAWAGGPVTTYQISLNLQKGNDVAKTRDVLFFWDGGCCDYNFKAAGYTFSKWWSGTGKDLSYFTVTATGDDGGCACWVGERWNSDGANQVAGTYYLWDAHGRNAREYSFTGQVAPAFQSDVYPIIPYHVLCKREQGNGDDRIGDTLYFWPGGFASYDFKQAGCTVGKFDDKPQANADYFGAVATPPGGAFTITWTGARWYGDNFHRIGGKMEIQHADGSRSTYSFSGDREIDAAVHIVSGKDGFWRIGQTASGAWWFVAPDGRPEFLNTVETVRPFKLSRGYERGKPLWHYVSKDWHRPNSDQKFLDFAADNQNTIAEHQQDGQYFQQWAQTSVNQIYDAGFKGIGAWSDQSLFALDVPISQDLNIYNAVGFQYAAEGKPCLLFCDDWNRRVDEWVRHMIVDVLHSRECKNLVGYYLDNEVNWSDEKEFGVELYFDQPAGSPFRKEVIDVIHGIWMDPDSFNQDWGTSFTYLQDATNQLNLPNHGSTGYQKLEQAWLYHLGREYFRTTTEAVKKYDPNHLILGVRFRLDWFSAQVLYASSDYVDATSFNTYPDPIKGIPWELRDMRMPKRPIIVSEYCFYSLKNRSYETHTGTYPFEVADQPARGAYYEQFTRDLARQKDIIGADWFEWFDYPPSDPEHVNFGVLDMNSIPYLELEKSVRETTPWLNRDHLSSSW